MSKDGFLPPGVEDSDIPGNRPEDIEWEELLEWISIEASKRSIPPGKIKECLEKFMNQYITGRSIKRCKSKMNRNRPKGPKGI
jgi:hypothetical protein